jgi:hypothetical protein
MQSNSIEILRLEAGDSSVDRWGTKFMTVLFSDASWWTVFLGQWTTGEAWCQIQKYCRQLAAIGEVSQLSSTSDGISRSNRVLSKQIGVLSTKWKRIEWCVIYIYSWFMNLWFCISRNKCSLLLSVSALWKKEMHHGWRRDRHSYVRTWCQITEPNTHAVTLTPDSQPWANTFNRDG